MTRMHLLLLIDRLEEIVAKSPRFAGRSLVSTDEILELVDKIRATLPEEIQQAETLMTQRDEYLKEVQAEAEKIKSNAKLYVDQAISQDIIVERAQEEADRRIREAEEAASQIETESHQYAHRILEQLEETLDKTLRVVRKGKEELLNTHKF
jgi:cell division septum initiation protein DivIVA